MQARSLVPARAAVLIPLAVSLSGCAAVKGIFKAGVWAGVIMVVLVVGLAFGAVRLLSR